MTTQRISIDPITRLEGHGKIDIFLTPKGDVAEAYLQIPELRGFERFCVGRLAEDMPNLDVAHLRRLPGSTPHRRHEGHWMHSSASIRRRQRRSCARCSTASFSRRITRRTSMRSAARIS